MKISFIGAATKRSYFYLKALQEHSITLEDVLIYDYKDIDLAKIVNRSLKYKNFIFKADKGFDEILKFYNVKIIDKLSINECEEEIKQGRGDIFIFSGKGGEIVSKNILNLKKFLHIHPGKLPEYRGSTTIYYSILNEKKIFATAFFLDTKIDNGDIVKEMEFKLVDCDIDNFFDNFIRTYLLVDVLKSKNFTTKKQDNLFKKEYYIIHPVLKNIAIKRCEGEKNI